MEQPLPQISLLSADRYDVDQLTNLVLRHFDLLGVEPINPACKVVVKPNLIMRCTPARTATTHPAMLEATIRALQSRGAKDITIADSPGGLYTLPLLRSAYEQSGIAAVAERCGIRCNFDLTSQELHRTENALCRSFDILSPVATADLLVNVCKVKTHAMMTFTCGVKNLFGCIPGLLKPQLHYRFPEEPRFADMLIDLCETLRPALTIVDGIDGMEGDGPTAGTPRHLGITAAARYDGIYALDAVISRMIGFEPSALPTIAAAARRGLYAPTLQAEILGDSAQAQTVVRFRPPTGKSLDFTGYTGLLAPVARLIRPLLTPHPIIRQRDCIGCGKCAETCPAHTIKLTNRKAHILPAACIRCFCCHELCPVKAIDIKNPRIFSFFSSSRKNQ